MPNNGNSNQQINIQTTGAGPGFPAVSGIAGQTGYPAANPPIKGATVPYWSYGSVVPTFTAPYGSLYSNASATTTASTGPLFVFVPAANSNGKWVIVGSGGGSSGVTQIVAGTNVSISPSGGTGVVTINATAPGGGVTQIVAGTGIAVSPSGGMGVVTVSVTGGPAGPVYDAVVLAESSCINYYKMNETSGTTVFDSKGSSNGTYYGSPILAARQLRSDNEPCPYFGQGGYAILPNPTTTLTSYSIEVLYVSSFSSNNIGAESCWIADGGYAASNGWGIALEDSAVLGGPARTGQVVDFLYPGIYNYTFYPAAAGTVHQAVFTFTSTGNVGQFFFDGFGPYNINSGGALSQANTSIGIAATTAGATAVYPIIVGKVSIYNAVLTTAQVAAHWNAQPL